MIDWNAIGCWGAVVVLGIVILGIVSMFLDYKAKWHRQSVELTKHDEAQEARIKELEKKNGHEQHQIDTLRQALVNSNNKISQLETFIKKNIKSISK